MSETLAEDPIALTKSILKTIGPIYTDTRLYKPYVEEKRFIFNWCQTQQSISSGSPDPLILNMRGINETLQEAAATWVYSGKSSSSDFTDCLNEAKSFCQRVMGIDLQYVNSQMSNQVFGKEPDKLYRVVNTVAPLFVQESSDRFSRTVLEWASVWELSGTTQLCDLASLKQAGIDWLKNPYANDRKFQDRFYLTAWQVKNLRYPITLQETTANRRQGEAYLGVVETKGIFDLPTVDEAEFVIKVGQAKKATIRAESLPRHLRIKIIATKSAENRVNLERRILADLAGREVSFDGKKEREFFWFNKTALDRLIETYGFERIENCSSKLL